MTYVIKRFGLFLLTVFVALTLNFFIVHFTPTDPVAALLGRLQSRGVMVEGGERIVEFYRQQFALDQPLFIQYFIYIKNLILTGDLGYSLSYFPAKVTDVVFAAVPWTLGLLLTSTLIAFIIGNLLGALAVWPGASKVSKFVAYGTMPFAAVPFYLLALILMYVFAFMWPIFPTAGTSTPGSTGQLGLSSVLDFLWHATLPALSLTIGLIGSWALTMRGVMTSVVSESYVTYGRVKGLKPRTLFVHYGLRNALLPQVTSLAIKLGYLVSGQVLVEKVFNYPGVGTVLYVALGGGDYFVVQGVVLFIVIATAFATLIVDLLYPLLDPRVKTEVLAR
jgi:peptide/nickel transport system permease protein